MATLAKPSSDPTQHSLLEDVYALFTGTTLIAIGLVLMKVAGIVTAGVAGLALLASYKTALGVGLLFFLINIPFLLLGLQGLGRAFFVKTAAAIGLILVQVEVMQAATAIEAVHPAFAALAGGTVIGMGILALVRHGFGVGGANILALWAQKSRGWNVGRLGLALDAVILLVAMTEIPLAQLGWSFLSVVAINGILIAYHRPGRYLGH
jgi:uncharacterized membrane-anchored protein YitT (DUF2179 family)